MSDQRKLTRTGTPGIYRRARADGTPGSYVIVYYAAGRQRKEGARTLEQARRIKREHLVDRDRGEWQEPSRITLVDYLGEWVERYQGNGRRGFRENTRDEYRRLLERYALRYFGERLRLVDVTPRDLALYVNWLCDESRQGRRLSDSSVANAVVPVRAALATARREGLIRTNPATGLALPVRERVHEDDDENDIRALSRHQLAALLAMAPDRHRLLVHTVASTGLRISEAIALQRRHLILDGSTPHLLVRRAIVRGRVEPPKTRHGRRWVALPAPLVHELRRQLADVADTPDTLVFPSRAGTPLDPDNLRNRMLRPLLAELGIDHGGWHLLRHTYASLQLHAGVNPLALSRAMGHHSAAFTLAVYTHLLAGDQAPALDLTAALAPIQQLLTEPTAA